MRLFNFLNEYGGHYENEGRSKSISKNMTIDLLRKYCQQTIKKDNKIYRGVDSTDSDFLFIDPSKFTRKSRNTSNYYTILLDGLPSWKKYPKRSESIVCSTDISKAGGYSKDYHSCIPYRVFPYDNAKIGVCSSRDMWSSFQKYFNDYLPDFNNVLKDICYENEIYLSNDMSINELYNVFDEIEEDKENVIESMTENYDFNNSKFWRGYRNNDISLKKLVEIAFDPNKNGFELETVSSFINIDDREVWTDSPCILIKTNLVKEIFKEL